MREPIEIEEKELKILQFAKKVFLEGLKKIKNKNIDKNLDKLAFSETKIFNEVLLNVDKPLVIKYLQSLIKKRLLFRLIEYQDPTFFFITREGLTFLDFIEKKDGNLKFKENNLGKFREITVLCPTCEARGEIKIQETIVVNNEGLTTVNVPKNFVCSHSFQVYIDKYFKIESYNKGEREFPDSSKIYLGDNERVKKERRNGFKKIKNLVDELYRKEQAGEKSRS